MTYMFKEEEVFIKVNSRNINYYREIGYEVSNQNFNGSVILKVKTKDIPSQSHFRIEAICEICGSENTLSVCKYYVNLNRNSKGYYSCFKCKNIEKEKTCIEKYGVSSFSKTEQFKKSESLKWKGIQKGSEKGRKTSLERYGVESYFQTDEMREMNRKWMSSDEFRSKSKETSVARYGKDMFCKTEKFKEIIRENKEVIVNKIKKSFQEKYGVDWPSKVESIVDKSNKTKELNGFKIPIDNLSDFDKYRKLVRKITNRNKKNLFENWDGFDYYDKEFIKGNFSYSSNHRLYPSIDHKISVMFGYLNDISADDVGDISNLCITKKFINSTKRQLIESDFLIHLSKCLN